MNLESIAAAAEIKKPQVDYSYLNKNKTYQAENYSLSYAQGKWRLYLENQMILREDNQNFKEIVNLYRWHLPETELFIHEDGKDTIKALNYMEELYYQQPDMNDFHTPQPMYNRLDNSD